jgi:hypothetical protein
MTQQELINFIWSIAIEPELRQLEGDIVRMLGEVVR